MTTRFGLKEITPNNWLEPDDIIKGFVRMSASGQVQSVTSDDYLKAILGPKLLEIVPMDVKSLFEVARGAMIYGYFFYPLYTLAAEQLFRVAEAAVTHKCKVLGLQKSNDKFKNKIDRLIDKKVIPSSELGRWDYVRKLRNIASHPESQSILTPGNAIGLLEDIVIQINSLFNVPDT
jgi:hypothetical protein